MDEKPKKVSREQREADYIARRQASDAKLKDKAFRQKQRDESNERDLKTKHKIKVLDSFPNKKQDAGDDILSKDQGDKSLPDTEHAPSSEVPVGKPDGKPEEEKQPEQNNEAEVAGKPDGQPEENKGV